MLFSDDSKFHKLIIVWRMFVIGVSDFNYVTFCSGKAMYVRKGVFFFFFFFFEMKLMDFTLKMIKFMNSQLLCTVKFLDFSYRFYNVLYFVLGDVKVLKMCLIY